MRHAEDVIQMRSGVLARHAFTLEGQLEFAALSGDWNPLHVDPVAARRTIFSVPVVHGVHLLLWALDAYLDAPVQIVELRALFRKPAHVGDVVVLHAAGADPIALTADVGDQRVLEVTLAVRPGLPPTASLPALSWPEPGQARLVSRAVLAVQHGRLALALDVERGRALLPRALAHLGALPVAELLAATRLVGMECPGLHSVFGGMTIAAGGSGAGLSLDYEVARTNLKYSLVDVAVRGPTLSGTLTTFSRPVPQPGPAPDQLRQRVTAGEFAGQRALVVGGSRGLGEALARCIAAGGGEVCLTYHQGADDAAKVVDEIQRAGGRASAFQLDVTAPVALRWPLAGAPTHLYYLATPRIPAVQRFAMSDLEHMMRYYVGGLHAVVEAAASLVDGTLHLWAPSTVFLDRGGGSAVYAIAKAAMEELCRQLSLMARVTVRCPRLPRIATDQTAGLIQLPAVAALDVALSELRAMPG